MKELRLVGTEFEVVRPPMESSNLTETPIVKYRVIAHKKVAGGEIVEIIKAI